MKGAKIITSSTERVTSHLDRLIKEGTIPGIQYIVVNATSTQFQYSGGVLDVSEPSAKVHDDSKFLSSSRIPNPIPVGWLHVGNDGSTFDEDKALQETLKDYPKLQFTPGERYAYSNLSYWLLGKAIEEVSGLAYSEYLKREIFTPLGIADNEMTFDRTSDNTAFARGHQARFSVLTLFFWALADRSLWDKSEGKWARFQQHLLMNGPAYGGCIGTASAYARVMQDMLLALQSDGEESKLFTSTVKDLLEPQYSSASKVDLLPSTCGGFNRGQLNKHTYYTKVGGGPGFSSNVRIYPEAGIATAFLCNKTEVSEGRVNAFLDNLDKEFL